MTIPNEENEELKKILLIDDEVSVCKFLRHSLEANSYSVTESQSGLEGLKKAAEVKPDLIVLDYGLADMSGLEVLKKLREWSSAPVLFLTVRDGEDDKIAALDSGADDYLTKPFSVPELLARIRVALRHKSPIDSTPILKAGRLEVDRSAHLVKADGNPIKLTHTEYLILCLLIKYAGKVVAHQTILKEIWGPSALEHTHYLRVYFGQIRKKIDHASPGAGDIIENESGVGYRLRI